jgi:hypothetical protein
MRNGVPEIWKRAALPWRQSARWHARVSESTGFTQPPASYAVTTANNAMLARYSAYQEPFYRALHAHRS